VAKTTNTKQAYFFIFKESLVSQRHLYLTFKMFLKWPIS